MTRKLRRAATIATAAMTLFALIGVDGSSAQAHDDERSIATAPLQMALRIEEPISANPGTDMAPERTIVSNEVVQDLPEESADEAIPAVNAASLADLVAQQAPLSDLSREMQCLAGAIYFEARGESLAGQLAVGRVITGRAESGRFPDSYCGVVYQRSQFSFVRGGRMPAIREGSNAWRNAVAIAQIAHEGSWKSEVDGALFFHARHVNPRWRLTRLAHVGNHVFYR